MTNYDEKSIRFRDRLIRLEQERLDNVEAKKDLAAEMKDQKLLKEEIAGIKLAVKRHFETTEKKTYRESVESFAESLGSFRDSPLGAAAIAAKKFIDTVAHADVTLHVPGGDPVHIGART
jgi:hypothetical protein